MTAPRGLAGAIVLVLTLVAVAGCAGSSASAAPTPAGGIGGVVTAGPTCPVERVPADPACDPRLVAGAVMVARDGSGVEVARATSGVDGLFFIPLGAGSYVLVPQPAEGLLGTAPEQDVDVVAGTRSEVVVVYDTGIRGPVQAP